MLANQLGYMREKYLMVQNDEIMKLHQLNSSMKNYVLQIVEFQVLICDSSSTIPMFGVLLLNINSALKLLQERSEAQSYKTSYGDLVTATLGLNHSFFSSSFIVLLMTS